MGRVSTPVEGMTEGLTPQPRSSTPQGEEMLEDFSGQEEGGVKENEGRGEDKNYGDSEREIAEQSTDETHNKTRSNVSPFFGEQASHKDIIVTSQSYSTSSLENYNLSSDIITCNSTSSTTSNNSTLVTSPLNVTNTTNSINIDLVNNNINNNKKVIGQKHYSTNKSDLSVLSDNVILIREILQTKLGNMMDSGGMMMSTGPRDFTRGSAASGINNNDVIKDAQTSNVAAANFMTHLLKVRAAKLKNISIILICILRVNLSK